MHFRLGLHQLWSRREQIFYGKAEGVGKTCHLLSGYGVASKTS
jgi:hypothetical protein